MNPCIKALISKDEIIGAIKWDGLDDAIIGTAVLCLHDKPVHLLVYSSDAIRQILQEGGMDPNEADEYIECNIETLWAGERTPITLRSMHLNIAVCRP